MTLRRSLATRIAASVALLTTVVLVAEQHPIVIDGLYADWSNVALAYTDTAGDGTGVDLGRLWIADDPRFLFLRFELGTEFDLSENNDLHLYLDTDADIATGLGIAGIGAELEWHFGARSGNFFAGGGSTSIGQANIRFRGAATVSAFEFEIAIGRDTLPDGANPLFTGTELRLLLVDNAGGDQLPNAGELLSYTLDQGSLPSESPRSLAREAADHLRIATHNVLFDSPWNGGQEPSFGHQYAAVAADILNFQEIYNHTPAQTAALVGRWVAAEPTEVWYAVGNADCKTVSRYPIIGSWPLDGNIAVLIDTTAKLGSPMLIINAHLPCCANDAGRQREVDRIMSFIREAQSPGGLLELAPDTPIMITGDLNLVGFAQQLDTLTTGDIIDEATFGADFAPDWDASELTSLMSRQTEKRMAYTWRNDNSLFWPGQLDFQIYSDSVLSVRNHFIIYTPEMSAAALAEAGMHASDSLSSDHLLFVADYRRPIICGPADIDEDRDIDLADLALLLSHFARPPGPIADPYDLDGDGDVDLADLAIMLSVFGTLCD